MLARTKKGTPTTAHPVTFRNFTAHPASVVALAYLWHGYCDHAAMERLVGRIPVPHKTYSIYQESVRWGYLRVRL